MRWKRLEECPVCGKDRCVKVPIKRSMIFCFRFNKAYWIKKDGSVQMLPRYENILEDKIMLKEYNSLFPTDETNYLYNPENPYYVPEKAHNKTKGDKPLKSDKLINENPNFSRKNIYRLMEHLGKSIIFKNAKLQKISLALMSQEYINKNYLNFIELSIDLTNKKNETMLVIARFSFVLGKPMGNIVLDDQICPDKAVLSRIEERINGLVKTFIENLKKEKKE